MSTPEPARKSAPPPPVRAPERPAQVPAMMLKSGAHSGEELYGGVVHLIERLHRRFLDVVRIELERKELHDINAVQALFIADLTEEATVRELMRRAYYLGSSISYNIKKLADAGYVVQERSPFDRRAVRVRLTEKGLMLAQEVRRLQSGHAKTLIGGERAAEELDAAYRVLRRLEQAWSDYVQFGHLNPL
ncbi:MAG TPA: MarR family winged helix-turn-helix transcriptional regulator [Alphaproteobacteria bacterium]|nr:MarR family winged helix-turn-helix transcriptional regulator [Alphaproteobacteria bacterium]